MKTTSHVLYLPIGSPDCQPGYDFYSRYFAPWNGIPEDPVTGRLLIPLIPPPPGLLMTTLTYTLTVSVGLQCV